MRVRFYGTRGSIATPGAGTVRFGGNTACVELITASGRRFILDCGTGARTLGTELMASGVKPLRGNILVGHTHWDHIHGFPFFAPIFVPGNEFSIYSPGGGKASLHDVLAGQMQYTYFPVELDQLPARISYHELGEGDHDVDGVKVSTQYLHHTAMTLGYRVEADGVVVVYVCDHEPFSETLWRTGAQPGREASILHDQDRRHARFLSGADLVIHDAQYTPEEYAFRKTWGHSTFEYAVGVAAAAHARRLALTHHDPGHDDAAVASIENQAQELGRRLHSPIEIFCAYEGCDLTLDARAGSEDFHETPSAAARSRIPAVLIVDDDPEIIRLARKALAKTEFEVSEATSGTEALREVRRRPPDLVVLDLVMPGLTGEEVLRALRVIPQTCSTPILVLTALSDEGNIQTCFDLGATDYLTKPFSIPQFATRVRACLARRSRD